MQHTNSSSIQVYLYKAKAQQFPQGILYSNILQKYQRENPSSQTIPYEQALGDGGKNKIPFDRKIQALEREDKIK